MSKEEQHNDWFIPITFFLFLYQHVHAHVSSEALTIVQLIPSGTNSSQPKVLIQ